MNRDQAEEIGNALMSDHRSSLSAKIEKQLSHDKHARVQRRIGAGALAGLAVGALIGHFVVGDWFTAGFIGLGCGSLIGRLLSGRIYLSGIEDQSNRKEGNVDESTTT